MKEIFENIRVFTNKGKSKMGKDFTMWGWYFMYKGKEYFSSLHNTIYKYDTISPMPTYVEREITPKEQIVLFEEMVNMMKEVT